MSISDAFFSVCKNAKPSTSVFVSLYQHDSVYGGPEEGGWMRSIVSLIAHCEFPTKELAESARVKVEELAAELASNSKFQWSEYCQAGVEWCEARGLDVDYLGEPNGATTFDVYVEDEIGEHEYAQSPYYE